MATKKRTLAGPGSAGSIKKTKDQLKKSSGNRIISGVPAKSNIIVRFLTEPGEWFGYHEVFDEELKDFYPLLAGMSEGHKGESASFRYLTNVVITDSEYDQDINKVVALRLPKTLANQLILKYDKFGTLLDRDYDLTRTGEGFDTVYDATPEAPSKFAFKKYALKDLEAVLFEAYDAVWSEDDDEDEDDPVDEEEEMTKKPAPKRRRKSAPEPVEEEDDEDEDEDEDEEDEPEADGEFPYTLEELSGMKIGELREVAEEWEVELPEGRSPKKAVAKLSEAFALEASEPEDEEEPEEEDEDEPDEDDEDAYTEEELLEMDLTELRELADDYGVTLSPTQRKSKRKIVDAIMSEAEEA